MKAGIFKPLKVRSFRSLFGAQLFSDLGNWLDFLAIQVIVAYQWGLDETAIAAVIVVIGLPWVIIGPFASVFVDRLPKKHVMITCLVLRIVFVAGLFFAPNLYILLVFLFLKGTVAAIYDPARQSAIRHTVSEEQLPEAVTLSQLSMNTMKIVGPALGGGIIALFGARSPFLFEIVGFFIALLFLWTLPAIDSQENIIDTRKHAEQKKKYWEELLGGMHHISQTPLLKISVILSSIALFIIFLYDGLFIFVAQKIGFSEGDFGILISAVGLGSVVGSLMMGNWTQWKHKPIQFMSIAAIFSGSLIIMMGLGSMNVITLPHVGWLAGAFLLGLLGSGESVPYGFILQSETPKEMMGRVSAAATSIQTFSMLIAPTAGALLAKWLGVSTVLAGAGSATCLLGIIILLFVANRVNIQKNNGEKHYQV